MDAQGRGRVEDIDPADQWVLNPETGEYELRLAPSAPQSRVPGQRGAGGTGRASRRRGAPASASASAPAPEREVPPPRRRRTSPEEPPPGRRGRRRPAKKSKGKKILLWTGGTMALVVLAAGTAGYLYLQHLNDNIESLPDDGAGTGGFQKDQAINILLIGTDKRTGSGNEGYGDNGSAGHADTTILLHVSKDRSNATALSIPRDLIVDIPDCPTTQEDGSTKVIPGSTGVRFNQSLGQSGRTPSCTMRTVTELTGVRPDNFMVADFNAVKTLTSAVGGVEVCLAKDINDPDSHLNLPAGKHTIEGEDALAFVRTRHSVGFGGDLSRIEIQQQFLSSLMRKLKSNDTLTSPSKMVKLAEAGTKALTVDSTLDDIGKLKDLGLELGKLNTKNLSFVTVPVRDNPAEKVKATVVLQEEPARQVFDMIKEDVSFTEVKKKESEKEKKEKAAVAARLEGEKSDPSEVRVRVLNGGAPDGSAQRELLYLQNEAGVTKSENAGDADAEVARTTLEYAPDQADQARALAEILGLSGAAMKPGESVTNAQGLPTMTLTLGKDFKGAGVKLDAASAEAPEEARKSTADKVECAK
ncbi:LytR family transcriptional regulator [Streptomyces sp. WAC04189]|uniref:LCP family protein n=3 Tax=Streptomyces TaxID=1883 RepID=UPI000D5252B0|nr:MULTISPECIES: LCP family protein [unclassified Streptomyces]MBU8550120.1 LCP family protein [Streptomyces sp. Osf17]MBU8556897.1 LCP family protein [Streptomyces sp. Babs14]PVD05987.1 LytR family transcriptional regulator [Streptomyces sp. CS207]RSR97505.1 LytR family transcriptional regulator [Streptomyces sp. WAC04189]RSS16498.1 LytR family transcriptional regulator [Streptomyces sp. WAC05458]